MNANLRSKLSRKSRALRTIEVNLRDEASAQDEGSPANEEKLRLTVMRRAFLSRLASRTRDPYPAPIVFISYSSKSGSSYKERATRAFEELGFEVRLGWDPIVQQGEYKLGAIKKHIEGSAVFLGICTPEYDLKGMGEGKCAPGVWVLEEKCIAQAYEKPVRLLIHNKIHSDFFEKIEGHKLQDIFEEANFESVLDRSVSALVKRYHEKLVLSYTT